MEAAGVDPRDVTWERDEPVYRVYFWTADGSVCDEWRLTGATDVHEVVAWAARDTAARDYVLYVEQDHDHGRGLVRLAGIDPSARNASESRITIVG